MLQHGGLAARCTTHSLSLNVNFDVLGMTMPGSTSSSSPDFQLGTRTSARSSGPQMSPFPQLVVPTSLALQHCIITISCLPDPMTLHVP
eukprot:3128931-Amphidinium_carterae.3